MQLVNFAYWLFPKPLDLSRVILRHLGSGTLAFVPMFLNPPSVSHGVVRRHVLII